MCFLMTHFLLKSLVVALSHAVRGKNDVTSSTMPASTIGCKEHLKAYTTGAPLVVYANECILVC